MQTKHRVVSDFLNLNSENVEINVAINFQCYELTVLNVH